MLKGQSAKKGREDAVKVEFVYCDGAREDVQLSGDWNDWKAIQMYHEGGGMWSVVTLVTPGAHEFKFIVDGEWKHSNRHPTIGIDETSLNNVRMVSPEPQYDGSKLPNEPAATPLAKAPKSVSNTTKTPSDAGSSGRNSRSSKTSTGSKSKGGGLFGRRR